MAHWIDCIEHGKRPMLTGEDGRAVLEVMGNGPYVFGAEPTGVDAIVFGALATSMLTPIESPIRDYLRSQPVLVAYADRMLARFFPELAHAPLRQSDRPEPALAV